jgi:hypothetical protein
MKHLLCPLAFVVLCCFGPAAMGASTGTYVWLPPAQFDHKPRIKVIERQADYWSVDQVCRSHMGARFAQAGRSNGRFEACAIQAKQSCTIVIPKIDGQNIDTETQSRLRRHEIGHCNGWPNDHPDGR